jgi:hypothetical protein
MLLCGQLRLRRRAAPRAAGAGPGARSGGAGGGWCCPQQPIVLSRNGKDFKITANQSTVRAGTEIRVKTERPEVAISLSEMAKDSWVVFELPGFANATSGKQQDSIDALRKATETSYFKGPDAVWVKLVIPTARRALAEISLARWTLKPALRYADKQNRTIATTAMVRNFQRSGQEPDHWVQQGTIRTNTFQHT